MKPNKSDYNKNFFPLILTGWYNCSIVSCSDFIETKNPSQD